MQSMFGAKGTEHMQFVCVAIENPMLINVTSTSCYVIKLFAFKHVLAYLIKL